MARNPASRPTPAQLEILRILWTHGPSTCRQVHDILGPQNGVGYTTILKLMQVMAAKALVVRDESQRSHVYRAKASEAKTKRALVKDLIERAFGGSTAELVVQALSAKPATKHDIEQIQAMIDRTREAGQ